MSKSRESPAVVDSYRGVWQGAIREQQFHDTDVAIKDRAMQRALPLSTRIDVGARPDQQGDHVSMAVFDREVER